MKKYLLKRLLCLIPVFLGVTILAFLLTGLSSVDAVDLKESSSGGVMSQPDETVELSESAAKKNIYEITDAEDNQLCRAIDLLK